MKLFQNGLEPLLLSLASKTSELGFIKKIRSEIIIETKTFKLPKNMIVSKTIFRRQTLFVVARQYAIEVVDEKSKIHYTKPKAATKQIICK